VKPPQPVEQTSDGFTVITNYESDPEVKKTLTFLEKGFGKRYSILKILRVLKQVTTVITYQFQIEVKFSQSTVLRYLIFVAQNPSTGVI